jgi:hypothetical protein
MGLFKLTKTFALRAAILPRQKASRRALPITRVGEPDKPVFKFRVEAPKVRALTFGEAEFLQPI